MYKKEKVKFQLTSNKIFPVARAFNWDVLFFHVISVLFLTEIKGFTYASVMFALTIGGLIQIVLQLPVNAIIKKIGLTTSIKIGAVLTLVFTSGILFVSSVFMLCAVYSFYRIAGLFNQSTFLSLGMHNLKAEGKENMFTEQESKGLAVFFLISIVHSLVIGFVFDFNAYLAMSFAVVASLINLVFSFVVKNENDKPFEHYEIKAQNDNKHTVISFIKKYKTEIFACALAACVIGTSNKIFEVNKMLLQEVHFSAVLISWIMLAVNIVKYISCIIYPKIKKIKNIGTVLSYAYFTLIILMSIIALTVNNLIVLQSCVAFLVTVANLFAEPIKIYVKEQIRKNYPEDMHQKTLSYMFLSIAIGGVLFGLFASYMLAVASVAATLAIITFACAAVLTLFLIIFSVITKQKNRKSS